MVRLSLYHNISPNNNNRFYLHSGNFKTFLSSYLAREINADNYRVNTNVIKLVSVGGYEYDDITYICEEVLINNVVKYTRYYHVNSVSYVSGYALLNVDVDLWATYIAQAQINNITITRCNRDIAKGIYDNIGNATKGALTYGFNNIGNEFDEDDVYAIAVLIYNAKQNLIGTQAITTSTLVACRCSELRQKAYNHDQAIHTIPIAEIVSDFFSNVYGVSNSSWIGTSNDAYVSEVYIVPSFLLPSLPTLTKGIEVKSLSYYCGDTTLTCGFVKTTFVQHTYDMPFYNIDYKYLAGLRNNGVELINYTKSDDMKISFYTYLKADSMQLIVAQGNRQFDITEGIKATLTTNNSIKDGFRSFIATLDYSINVGKSVSGAIDAIQGGDTGQSVRAVGGAVQTITKPALNKEVGSITGKGDAKLNYYGLRIETSGSGTEEDPYVYTYYMPNPFCITLYQSINNEKANARLNGANFDEIINNIASVFNYSLLGEGDLADTYIKASCLIDGIPSEASNYIKNTLAGGVYLVDAR